MDREIMIRFCGVGMWMTLCWLMAGAAVNAADNASQRAALRQLFPQSKEIAGWRLKSGPAFFDGDQIFKYMDGAGEIPLGYGFRRLATARYERRGAAIEVVVFEMGDSKAAFGYYSVRDRSSDELFVGPDRRIRLIPGFALIAWKDHSTLVVSVEEGEVADGVLLEFGNAILSRLPNKGAPPDLLRYLPKDGRVANSERYIRGKATFDAEVKFILDDVFGLRGDVEAAAAHYRTGKREYDLALLRYQSQRAATKALTAFADFLKASHSVKSISSTTCIARDPQDGFIGGFCSARFVGVVLRTEDEDAAERILHRFRGSLARMRE